MSTKFTELIELNQIDINCRIDDVINKIASKIEYVLLRPYPGTLNYDSKIIAVIEDIDLELRYAEVSVINGFDVMPNDGESVEYLESYDSLEEIENIIRVNDRNLYNEKLSYEKWESFKEKLSEFGEVIILNEYVASKSILDNYKFAIILNSNEAA